MVRVRAPRNPARWVQLYDGQTIGAVPTLDGAGKQPDEEDTPTVNGRPAKSTQKGSDEEWH